MKREQLGSRLGFIMLSAGCAIGCGNVWKFRGCAGKMAADFMLIYLLCLVILGIRLLCWNFPSENSSTSPFSCTVSWKSQDRNGDFQLVLSHSATLP